MKYVIGIDGGGTKTLLKLADLKGRLLAAFEGGPCNINSSAIKDIAEMLRELIYKGVNAVKGDIDDCLSICLGSAGVDRPDEKEKMENILRDIGLNGVITVTNDAQTALYGGVGGREGVIVISGTGSICYGRNEKDEYCRSGGWGHIMGDEGSGYYIGVQALNNIMRSHDGRKGATLLTPMVLKYLGIDKPEGLINYVYRSGAGKKEIAGLAKIVDKAYIDGDEAARVILYTSAQELYEIAQVVICKLSFNNKPIPLAVGGSVLNNNKYILDVLTHMVNLNYPLINVIKVKDDAAWGAVLIAIEAMEKEVE